jgi:adenylate cyclase
MPNYTVARWVEDGKGWSDNALFLSEFARIGDGLRLAGLPD